MEGIKQSIRDVKKIAAIARKNAARLRLRGGQKTEEIINIFEELEGIFGAGKDTAKQTRLILEKEEKERVEWKAHM
jgi:hypothetical protein